MGLASREVVGIPRRYLVIERLKRLRCVDVLRAYDVVLEREVVIERIRDPDDESGNLELLVADAQRIAKLDHPNIARIFDVELVAAGLLLVVREIVTGDSLVTSTRRGASPNSILERFVQLGRGLSAAHRAGVVHRNVSPAHAFIDDCSVRMTAFAWPPGVVGSNDDLDSGRVDRPSPAADQRALCAALRDALGDAPMPRVVTEAIRRGTAERPEERWPSMDALLAKLEKRKRSTPKWWLAATGATAVLASLLASQREGLTGQSRCRGALKHVEDVWGQERRAAVQHAMSLTEAAYAETLWHDTSSTLDEYMKGWASAYTETCEEANSPDNTGSERLDRRMGCLSGAKREVAAITDVLSDADSETLMHVPSIMGGLRSLSQCSNDAALSSEIMLPQETEKDAVGLARARLEHAQAQRRAARFEAARAELEEVRTMVADLSYPVVAVELLIAEGDLADDLAEYQRAEAALTDALDRGLRLRLRHHAQDAAASLIYLYGDRKMRPDLALSYRYIARGLAHDDPAQMARTVSNIGNTLREQDKLEEAAALFRKAEALYADAHGPQSHEVMIARNNLAITLRAQGKFLEAEREIRAVLATRIEALGPTHPRTASVRHNLANILFEQRRLEEAEAEHLQVVEIVEAVFGPQHPQVANAYGGLAAIHYQQRLYEQSAAEARRVVDIRTAVLGAEHPEVASMRSSLGLVLTRIGHYDEAERELRAAIASMEKAAGRSDTRLANACTNLAALLHLRGEFEDAERELRRSLELLQHSLRPGHPSIRGALLNLAVVLESQAGRDEEARKLRSRASKPPEYSEGTFEDRRHVAVDERPPASSDADLGRARGRDDRLP